MSCRKLIETTMPVHKINTEAEREKTARNGKPSNVHVWWSKESMAVERSVLFASLVDDPVEHPEMFPREAEQIRERERLVQLTKRLSEVESTDDKVVLDSAKKEILRYSIGNVPTVFDPFSGSGTTSVEAHRLGLMSESSDLNAVAAMITTVVSDIPARFSNTIPVHPRKDRTLPIALLGSAGIAEDIQYYGNQIQKKAFRKIGSLYPKVINPDGGDELEVSAWIWARTVKCPNPKCSCNIPLSSSYDLAKKKGNEAWLEPAAEDGKIHFKLHRTPHIEGKEKPKVAQTAVFKCPECGQITPDAYVKECGINHQINSQLIAIVADDGNKRLYLESTENQEKAATVKRPKKIPHGELPLFPQRFSPPSFGLTDYADLFTNRQLVFITTMLELVKHIQKDIEKSAIEKGFANDGISFADGGKGAKAYSEAIRIVLVLTVSKLLDRCSNMCSWSTSGGGSLRNVFSRAAMPMIWDYAEGNPFAESSGSFTNTLARICDSIARLPAGIAGNTQVADATFLNDAKDVMISTDLPYYDHAAYQELSDFFYVWMKYGLEDLYPDYFIEPVTSKKKDLTSFSYRYSGDKKQAESIYNEGLKAAIRNLYESATDKFPSTLGFIYKGNCSTGEQELSEWEKFITAVCNAGFSITASWPLGRKYESDILLSESKGIPIVIVVRKKDSNAQTITRRSFVASVKREIPELLAEMSSKVGTMDLRASLIGRALNIFSRNKQVIDADGLKMKPYMASRIIEQEIDMLIATYYENNVTKVDNEEESNHVRES
jgi:putative DNA methylase